MKLTRWQWGVVVLLVAYVAVSGPVTSYAGLLGQMIGGGITATLVVAGCAFASRKIRGWFGSRRGGEQAA